MLAPRIFPMVPCGFPMVPCGSPIVLCGFPMVLCHGAAIRHSPAQLCGLPDGAPFAAASSQRHQPIVASAALPLPCRSPSAAASTLRHPLPCRGLRRCSRYATGKAHKNADSVLEKPENEGSGGQKRTKTPILCSKCPKTGVPKAK